MCAQWLLRKLSQELSWERERPREGGREKLILFFIHVVCDSVRATLALYFTLLPLNITKNLSLLTVDEFFFYFM